MRVNRGLYNNTFATDAGDSVHTARSYLTVTTDVEDVMRNNIYRDDVVVAYKVGMEVTNLYGPKPGEMLQIVCLRRLTHNF